MHISTYYTWLLLQIVLVTTCFVVIIAKGGGRGGGGRGGGRGSSGGGRRSSSSSGRGSSYGSKPSPSHSLPSPSHSLPSPSNSRPSTYNSRPMPVYPRPSPSYGHGGHSPSYARPYHHLSWPSHSSSSGSEYDSEYRPSSYDWYDKKEPYRPFPTFRPMEPLTIPPRLVRPISPDDPYWDKTYRPKPPGDCEPFSSLNVECPPGYKELQSSNSIYDIVASNNNYEKPVTWTYKFTERNELDDCGNLQSLNLPCPPEYRRYYFNAKSISELIRSDTESFEFESRNKPAPVSNRKTGFQGGSCSPYSELKLPCPPDYESSMKKEVQKEPSISVTKSKPVEQNNKKFQVQIKNIRPYSCTEIRYLEYYLGGYTWQPNCSIPAPSYMNYVGIPTGANMNRNPLKRKGFIGSLMSANNSEQIQQEQTRYHGSYPTPYGITYLKKWGEEYVNQHFLGKHSSSASLYTIFPFMTPKNTQKVRKINSHSVSMYVPPRRFHQHRHLYSTENGQIMDTEYDEYFNVFGDDYAGKCQQPLKGELAEIKCKATLDEIKCNATCINGYHFPENGEFMMNRCWHVTGVWSPQKNFPVCTPLCDEPCQNGGECIKQGKCRCRSEFRGNRCEFHFLKCDIRLLISEEKRVSWVCHHFTNGTVCKVNCKEPAQFEYPSTAEYKCTPDGLWTPDVLPRCIVKENQ